MSQGETRLKHPLQDLSARVDLGAHLGGLNQLEGFDELQGQVRQFRGFDDLLPISNLELEPAKGTRLRFRKEMQFGDSAHWYAIDRDEAREARDTSLRPCQEDGSLDRVALNLEDDILGIETLGRPLDPQALGSCMEPLGQDRGFEGDGNQALFSIGQELALILKPEDMHLSRRLTEIENELTDARELGAESPLLVTCLDQILE